MAQTSARPPQVMRGQFRHTDAFRAILHNVPDRLFRHAVSPCPPHPGDPAKDPAPGNSSRAQPLVQLLFHPVGDRNRPDVPRLAHEIDNRPAFFALLYVIHPHPNASIPPPPTTPY